MTSRPALYRRFMLLAACLFALGCADESSGFGHTGPSTACPGGVGCPCKDNAECDTALCLETAAGKRCAATCVDSCEPGFQCIPVSAGGGDTVNICAPLHDWLCDPCEASSSCQKVGIEASACVRYGLSGGFCGIPCSSDVVCATGYACQQVTSVEGATSKQCVRPAAAAPTGSTQKPR
mgnify:CR=1 FL=1